MTPGSRPTRTLEARWSAAGAGEHYVTGRWRSRRAARRDPRLVARILAGQDRVFDGGYILDTPCGTGRLRETLEATGAAVLGVDIAGEMLAQGRGARVRATCRRLPFRAGTFDAVVCCRLLHHLPRTEDRSELLTELVRVSRDLVIASFWDASSLHAWRRRRGLRRAAHPDQRSAVHRTELEAELERAGAQVLGYEHSLRFVSQQAFVVARKRDRRG